MFDEIESELKQMIEASDTGGVGGGVVGSKDNNGRPMKQKLINIFRRIAMSFPVLLLFVMTVSEY